MCTVSVGAVEASEVPPNSSPRAPRVLVVEDNPISQRLAVMILGKLGVEVEAAGDGLQALAAAETRDFDLIIMDCQMPEMDGWEATRALRLSLALPIVGLTANRSPDEVEACLAAGMNECLEKPVTRELLEQTIARWIHRDGAAAAGPVEEVDLDLAQEIVRQLEPFTDGVLSPGFFDLADALLSDVRQSVETITRRHSVQDTPGIRRESHALGGCSRNLGASAMGRFARLLENPATHLAGHRVASLIQDVRRELGRVDAAVASLRARGVRSAR